MFINLLQDMRYGIITKENEKRLRSRISKDFMQMDDIQFINGKQRFAAAPQFLLTFIFLCFM